MLNKSFYRLKQRNAALKGATTGKEIEEREKMSFDSDFMCCCVAQHGKVLSKTTAFIFMYFIF
jgi:hypothetical protein